MKATIVTAALVLGLAGVCAAQDDPERRFQEALRVEDGEGARAALARFEALAADASAPALLRARALLRAGAARERLGDLEGARAAWQRVVTEHGALGEVLAEARAALARVEARAKLAVTVTAAPARPDGRPRVNLEARDADVRALLCRVAQVAGLNLVLGSEVRGTVTLTLRDVDAEGVLRTIAETIGELSLVRDASGEVLRISATGILDQQLELRAWRLAPLEPGPAAVDAWLPALKAAQELLDRARVHGTMIELDPASHTVFVCATPSQLEQLRDLFAGVLAPAPAASVGSRVNVEAQEGDVRALLRMLAAEQGRPLLLSASVRGKACVVARSAPADAVLRQVALAAGEYDVVSTPAGDAMLGSGQCDQWLVTEAWPVALSPTELWGAGGWLLWAGNDGVHHPLERVALSYLDARRVHGACVGLDVVGHTLVVRATPRDLGALRAALAVAGYVAPLAPASGPLALLEDGTSIRAAVEQAAGTVNVLLAPSVRGELAGTWRKEAPLLEVLRLFAAVTGEYEVQPGAEIVRMLSRGAAAQQLETRRLTVARRTAEGLDGLAAILVRLVDAQKIHGAALVRTAGTTQLLASLPRGLLDEVAAVLAACDSAAPPAPRHPVLTCAIGWPVKGEGSVHRLGAGGFERVGGPIPGPLPEQESTVELRLDDETSATLVTTTPRLGVSSRRFGVWPLWRE